jgi:HEAT repeat protein
MKSRQILGWSRLAVLVATLLVAAAGNRLAAFAADGKGYTPQSESKLIGVLKSGSPPAEKALACKQLAVCGTKAAVPPLADLLSNTELASWARIALEAIPDPAADAALRKELGRLQGKLLIGTINSIAVRRDAKAVRGLDRKLHDADPEVASAAGVALGHIGGAKAAKTLAQSLADAPPAVRPAVAEGCILCADAFLAQGNLSGALKLYDAVRAAAVPKQRLLEATRGAILARQSAGIPLLLEQLRSPDKAFYGIGLRTARELKGRDVTEALVAELKRCPADRQPLLLLAVADREDPTALAAVVEAAGSNSPRVQIAAIGVLERRGNLSSVPVLLQAATSINAEVAKAALGALTRLPGNEVDADLLARLAHATGKQRQVLIDLAGRRRIEAAVPAVVALVKDPDPAVRRAAVQTIGELGNENQVETLVRLLQKRQDAKEVSGLETTLIAIGGRSGARCVPALLPLVQSGDNSVRIIGLHVVAAAGGTEALAIVKAALDDKDEAVRDEAVRALSTWPNNWPEESGVVEPLLTLAKYSKKTSYQVLGLRGYLNYLQGDKTMKDDEKVAKVKEALLLAKRPEEKRLAIGVLGTIPTATALTLLTTFTAQPAVAEDACVSLVKLAGDKAAGISKSQRQQALETAAARSPDPATKKKAKALLKKIE